MKRNTLPYWRLRRFAPRTLAILERNGDSQPVIGAYQTTIGVSAVTFKDLYDESLINDGAQDQNHEERRDLSAKLHRTFRSWVSLVASVVTTIDPTEYGDNPSVPDDLLSDLERFFLAVAKWEETNGALAFSEAMHADLTQAREALVATMSTVGSAAAARSGMTAKLKEAAIAFHRDLVAFRRSLASLYGSSHADYQKLRTIKAQTPDVDDDDVADDMPPSDEPPIEEALEDAIAEEADAEEAAE